MKVNDFLPVFTSNEAKTDWLKSSAKESFKDERKTYFSEEEVNELSKESCVSGGEILSLDDIMKMVKDLVENGSEETLSVEIPMTSGTKALKESRKQRDLKVRKGFEVTEVVVYGIVDDEKETMRYFTESGVEIEERERNLSAKEKREFLGMFMQMGETKTGTNN